jgi:hypothetical protein
MPVASVTGRTPTGAADRGREEDDDTWGPRDAETQALRDGHNRTSQTSQTQMQPSDADFSLKENVTNTLFFPFF